MLLLQVNADHNMDGIIDFFWGHWKALGMLSIGIVFLRWLIKELRRGKLLRKAGEYVKVHNPQLFFTDKEKILYYDFVKNTKGAEGIAALFRCDDINNEVFFLCLRSAYEKNEFEYQGADLLYANSRLLAALQSIRRSSDKNTKRFVEDITPQIMEFLVKIILEKTENCESSIEIARSLFFDSPFSVHAGMNHWDATSNDNIILVTENILESITYKKLVGKECDMIREETKNGIITEKVLQLMKREHPAKTKMLFWHTLDIALRDACIRNWNLENGNFGTLELVELANSYRLYAMTLSGLCCC